MEKAPPPPYDDSSLGTPANKKRKLSTLEFTCSDCYSRITTDVSTGERLCLCKKTSTEATIIESSIKRPKATFARPTPKQPLYANNPGTNLSTQNSNTIYTSQTSSSVPQFSGKRNTISKAIEQKAQILHNQTLGLTKLYIPSEENQLSRVSTNLGYISFCDSSIYTFFARDYTTTHNTNSIKGDNTHQPHLVWSTRKNRIRGSIMWGYETSRRESRQGAGISARYRRSCFYTSISRVCTFGVERMRSG
eukprot:TRINITY_DN6651_c0_g3_i2.p1 TRINITY_DN6651_c0_g3~~TRINITY_DN6651_c0_g3_i2.p1  ORF type:complete len:265 (+),score=13.87 TRINITY_DN6651_c0_g3_i2:49-795(+)